MVLFVDLFWYLHYLKQLLEHIERIHYLFLLIGFIVAFFVLIHSGKSIYDPPWFGFIYDTYNTINEHNQGQTYDLSYFFYYLYYFLFWILFLSESKNYFITSPASSLIMISMLSIYECITRSSLLSKEERYLLLLIEFSMWQMFWYYLWCLLNMV